MFEYFADDEYVIKKSNRRAKRDKIERSKEAFMKLNGRGLLTDTLPTIVRKSKQAKKGKK